MSTECLIEERAEDARKTWDNQRDNQGDAQARAMNAEERVDRLEAELEHTERRLQVIITRYERLLEEKDRQLSRRQETTADEGESLLSRIVSKYG
ncbi:hypothetical protein OB919_18235 [Halobacteria archaeon AArc-curdl1]|uniref:Uncharacterized protein n=1 Tax=Natronosalvus hydrolyticus TaxID=2979988 RepID=A0AAP3E966_9EURY|nr:hypothetical protein [Halobacteria archaeon AArc-curdl1]